jgi:hypothetical protein
MKVITIGRDSSNEVVINDDKVSRNHLQIIQDDLGNFRLADFGSINGTFVNGNKVSGEVSLNPDDSLRIGDTTLPWKDYFALNLRNTDPDLSNGAQNSCAKIHFYRTKNLMGRAIIPQLRLNDTPLTKIEWNWKWTFIADKPGIYTFWTQTEAKKKLEINVEMGQEYYVHCYLSMGFVVGRCKLELVDAERGLREMSNLKQY